MAARIPAGGGVGMAASDVAVGGANEPISVTLPAPGQGLYNVISHILVSFSGDLYPDATLQVVDNGAVVLDCDIISAVGGPTVLDFSTVLVAHANSETRITLSAGGAAISGKLTVRHFLA